MKSNYLSGKTFDKLTKIVLYVGVLIRIILYMNTPFFAYYDQVYDDRLLFRYLDTLLNKQWLGTYDHLTLIKGISYSLFMWFCEKTMIPYSVALAMLTILAAYIFVLAFKPVISNTYIRRLLFVLLIYSPVTFYGLISQRLYRMALTPCVSLLAFSVLIGIFFRIKESNKLLLCWSILAGFMISFFWFLREDSVWILPFWIVISICALWGYIWSEKPSFLKIVKKLVVLIVPFIILFSVQMSISFINYRYYGYFGVNDRTEGGFAKLMSHAYSFEDKYEDNIDVWVSLNTLYHMMEVSPTFATIGSKIDAEYAEWGMGEEITGDCIQWVIREAVYDAGYYESATTAQDFYQKVNQELEDAIKNGNIQTVDLFSLSSQAKGIELSELKNIIKSTFDEMKKILIYSDCTAWGNMKGNGNRSEIRHLEGILNSRLTGPDFSSYQISGWIFAKNTSEELTIVITNSEGVELYRPLFKDSVDVHKVFPEYDNNQKCRVDFWLYDVPEDILIDIYMDHKRIDTISLGDVDTEQYRCDFDWKYYPGEDEIVPYVTRTTNWENNIVRLYKVISPFITLATFVCYILGTILVLYKFCHKDYTSLAMWIAITGILLGAFVLCFGVAYFSRSFRADMEIYLSFYMAGAFMLLQAWKYLSIFLGTQIFYELKMKVFRK